MNMKKLHNFIYSSFSIIVAFAYIFIGFLFNTWHPTWLLFLTVPCYYMLITFMKNRDWYTFPYPILCVILYLTAGFGYNLWHPAWLLFLTIPCYYMLITFMKSQRNGRRGDWNTFPYPILCVILFLTTGFDYNLWHPMWLIFLTIPIFYIFVNARSK